VAITSSRRIGALALLAAVAVAACGGGASPTPAATQAPGSSGPGASAPAGVSGSITVSGSSTVEPVSTGVAELLKQSSPDFNYTVEGPGTGDGFKRFCAGETDISDASRKIKDAEAEACRTAGIEYTELKIAYDGMTVMTNPANNAITCLSFADLYALIGPESTGFDTWAKAAALAKELGSNTALPEAPLAITGPGEESGTFDSFVELAIKPIADSRKVTPVTTRPDYTASANDNAIIEGVAGSDTSLGWVGFAFAQENTDKIKELQVSKEPNGACVAPTAVTIADGTYPLSRSLYIYVNKAKAAANPAVVGYVDYYLAEGTISKVLEVVPYVNMPASELDRTRTTWESSK
jgi:phosphate transport system substrate-binding protein